MLTSTEIKREEKRASTKMKSKYQVFYVNLIFMFLGNSVLPEDSEELVEKKLQLAKQKEAYKQLTGKDYDKTPKGRLRGLRRVVAAARSLRRREKLGITISSREPPILQRYLSGDNPHLSDSLEDSNVLRYSPVRIPQRWEIFPNSNTPREFLTPEAYDAIILLFKVLFCFILSCLLEHKMCAYQFI